MLEESAKAAASDRAVQSVRPMMRFIGEAIHSSRSSASVEEEPTPRRRSSSPRVQASAHGADLRNGFWRVEKIEERRESTGDQYADALDDPFGGYPPWIGEIHGLSQALRSGSRRMRIFWWIVLFFCTTCGIATTTQVVVEYIHGSTATSTTIKLVDSMEMPSLTICPKIADALRVDELYEDMQESIPGLSNQTSIDLLKFWLGGSGVENIAGLAQFNQSYLEHLAELYDLWSAGYERGAFFNTMQMRYGYRCEDLFRYCEIGGKPRDCCDDLFQEQSVVARGLCFQSRRNVNQTEADETGRLILFIKQPVSATSTRFDYRQPQIIVYVNSQFGHVIDHPRYYVYPNEWTRMHIAARFVELLEHSDCVTTTTGQDGGCIVRNWVLSTLVDPFNCTVPYLHDVPGVPDREVCHPLTIARDYYNLIEVMHTDIGQDRKCLPGCRRWEYEISMMQSAALDPFEGFRFNLEVAYYDLQYEHIKEISTTSIPGLMSQIGGQFGFFLGLSIITMIQILVAAAINVLRFLYRIYGPMFRGNVVADVS